MDKKAIELDQVRAALSALGETPSALELLPSISGTAVPPDAKFTLSDGRVVGMEVRSWTDARLAAMHAKVHAAFNSAKKACADTHAARCIVAITVEAEPVPVELKSSATALREVLTKASGSVTLLAAAGDLPACLKWVASIEVKDVGTIPLDMPPGALWNLLWLREYDGAATLGGVIQTMVDDKADDLERWQGDYAERWLLLATDEPSAPGASSDHWVLPEEIEAIRKQVQPKGFNRIVILGGGLPNGVATLP